MTLGSLHNFLSPGASTRLLPNVITLLNLNFRFTSKRRVSSDLSNCRNIITSSILVKDVFSSADIFSCRNVKPPICRSVEQASPFVENTILLLISWRQNYMYTNCPPAKMFRLFWRNNHLLSTNISMPCHLIPLFPSFYNLKFPNRFIITLFQKTSCLAHV